MQGQDYFDYNATAPASEAAMSAWNKAAHDHWHNPSSLYREAATVSQLLEDLRGSVADLLDCEDPERVLFNSGATEANNAVLGHIARTTTGKVAISAVEHPCVADCARELVGDRLVELPVDSAGVVDLEHLSEWLAEEPDVALVSVMAANNESGTLQPWRKALQFCREREVAFHCDAAQWIGKLPSKGLGECAYVTGSAHKFGGPKGTGFLLLPEDADDFRSLLGGPQQEGRRAGTENFPGIAAMLAAWEALEPELERISESGLRDRRWAEESIVSRLPGTRIVGEKSDRLWNTILCIVPEFDNRRWLTRLNRRGFCVSTGSACSSGKENPSRVMLAMDYDFESMGRTLRLSAGWNTKRADWQALVDAICEVSADLAGGRTQIV